MNIPLTMLRMRVPHKVGAVRISRSSPAPMSTRTTGPRVRNSWASRSCAFSIHERTLSSPYGPFEAGNSASRNKRCGCDRKHIRTLRVGDRRIVRVGATNYRNDGAADQRDPGNTSMARRGIERGDRRLRLCWETQPTGGLSLDRRRDGLRGRQHASRRGRAGSVSCSFGDATTARFPVGLRGNCSAEPRQRSASIRMPAGPFYRLSA
jgi:hypothetical protein